MNTLVKNVNFIEKATEKELIELIELAKNSFSLDELKLAKSYTKIVLNTDETCIDAWLLMGSICFKENDISEALKFFSKANTLAPQNSIIPVRIGEVYTSVGNHVDAIELFKTALRLDSTSEDARIGLVKAYLLINEPSYAEEVLKELTKFNPLSDCIPELTRTIREYTPANNIASPTKNNSEQIISENENKRILFHNKWKQYASKMAWPIPLIRNTISEIELTDNDFYIHALNKLSAIELRLFEKVEINLILSEVITDFMALFEEEEPNTALYFSLSRAFILNNQKEEAKMVLATLLKVPNFNVIDRPFLLPLKLQDFAPTCIDESNWIKVRLIEAYLSLLDENELQEPIARALHHQIQNNEEALQRFGGNALEVPLKVFPYDFWDGFPSNEKAKKVTSFARKLSESGMDENLLLQIVDETSHRLSQHPTDNVAFFIQTHALLGFKPVYGSMEKNFEDLDSALMQRKWWNKHALYTYWFNKIEFLKAGSGNKVSAIVIANKFKEKSIENLRRLHDQLEGIGEIVFVNNGLADEEFASLFPYVHTFVTLNGNAGAYLARNIGSLFAKGKYLLFVDDDGIPDQGFINAHLIEHKNRENVIVSRGVYYSDDVTEDPWHYNIGDKVKPAITILEGNAMYDSQIFFEVGGWGDYILFGFGGTELSYRIFEKYPDKYRQIYVPGSRLFHQYFRGEAHKSGKKIKQKISKLLLDCLHPELEKVTKSWPSSFGEETTLYVNYSWDSNDVDPQTWNEVK